MEPKTELQRNALADIRRKELEIFQRALDVKWLDSRMEDGRMGRSLALIKQEAQLEKDFQERTDHAALVNERARKETALGKAIATLRREENDALLRRHQLRQKDPRLKELIKKLEAGYVCRDLKQQIMQNEYRRLQNKAEENRASLILRNSIYNDKEQKEKEERETFASQMQYSKELQDQLDAKEKDDHERYEEQSKHDKLLIDNIMKKIQDEDTKVLNKKREMMKTLKQEMYCSFNARAQLRREHLEMLGREEQIVAEQAKAVADRTTSILEERARKNREREELNQRIAAKVLADAEARQKRTDMIKLLQEQEQLEKNYQDDKAEKDKVEKAKRDTKESLTEQMENRKREAQREKERAARFREFTESKIREDDEKEKMKEDKKKEKRRQYAAELKRQIQDNEVRRRAEAKLEDGRALSVWDYDNALRTVVEEERKEIMRAHGPYLLGCLQAGVVKGTDLPAIQEGLQSVPHLAHLDLTSMSSANRHITRPKCNAQCRVIREY